MAVYCIDDGGDGTQTNATQTLTTLDWSKADTSIANLIAYDAAAFTTSGNVIYFGDDHNNPTTGAAQTIAGPASGAPVILISADRTLSTATYKVGSGNQINSSDGAYDIVIDGSFAIYGLLMKAGNDPRFTIDTNEYLYVENCTFAPGAGRYLSVYAQAGAVLKNITVDLTADATTPRNNIAVYIADASASVINIDGLSFVWPQYRTGSIVSVAGNGSLYISGADFSGFTNATMCELIGDTPNYFIHMTNCKTKSAIVYSAAETGAQGGRALITNCDSANNPAAFYTLGPYGVINGSTSVYRTGGAQIEGIATSWLVRTMSICTENVPYFSPWIYGTIASTGSKTFDLYITNDTADFTDAQVWPEVEYFATAGVPTWTRASGQRATITTTPAAHTDDVTSTWNGAGPSFTYKQKLSVTATVNETGQYRARVGVGVASIDSSRYFYVDPAVYVT